MIAYYGPYNARLGAAVFLGQDAVIVPTPLPKASPPDPEPQGPQAAPTAVPAVVVPPEPSEPTVSIGGHQVRVVPLVLAGVITLGAIALVVSTTSSIKRL